MEAIKEILLEAKDVSKKYGTCEILKGLSLQVAFGEAVAVMGKSGSGKTTLLNLLGGLDQPDTGAIRFQNVQLKKGMLRKYRRDHVGFLFQDSGLVEEFTALQNVEAAILISKKKFDPIVFLEMVGMAEYKDAFPWQLSGGQGHRVALARALSKKPEVLLLDEPTEGQDAETGQEIIELTLKICREQKIALVVVTHRLEHAAMMDRQLYLTEGVLIERTIT